RAGQLLGKVCSDPRFEFISWAGGSCDRGHARDRERTGCRVTRGSRSPAGRATVAIGECKRQRAPLREVTVAHLVVGWKLRSDRHIRWQRHGVAGRVVRALRIEPGLPGAVRGEDKPDHDYSVARQNLELKAVSLLANGRVVPIAADSGTNRHRRRICGGLRRNKTVPARGVDTRQTHGARKERVVRKIARRRREFSEQWRGVRRRIVRAELARRRTVWARRVADGVNARRIAINAEWVFNRIHRSRAAEESEIDLRILLGNDVRTVQI